MKRVFLLITILYSLNAYAGWTSDLANAAKDIKEAITSLYQGIVSTSTVSESIHISDINVTSLH